MEKPRQDKWSPIKADKTLCFIALFFLPTSKQGTLSRPFPPLKDSGVRVDTSHWITAMAARAMETVRY